MGGTTKSCDSLVNGTGAQTKSDNGGGWDLGERPGTVRSTNGVGKLTYLPTSGKVGFRQAAEPVSSPQKSVNPANEHRPRIHISFLSDAPTLSLLPPSLPDLRDGAGGSGQGSIIGISYCLFISTPTSVGENTRHKIWNQDAVLPRYLSFTCAFHPLIPKIESHFYSPAV